MKRSKARQDGKRQYASRALAIMVSFLLHGMVVLGIVVITWFWGRPGFERVSAYTVSLVDAPLSLTQPPEAVAPPPSVVPPKDRDDAPAPVNEPPTEKPRVKKSEPPVATPEPSPKDQKKAKAATLEPRPVKKDKPSKPKAAAKPKPPVEPNIATSKEARSAIDRLRQQQARQEKQRQQDAMAQKQAAAKRIEGLREHLAQTANAGDQTGATAGLQRVRFAAYQERVRTRIIQAWVLPLPPEQSQALQATVFFRVRRDGHVDGLDVVKPSGNALFDASLVRAITRASPLPALPTDYPKDLLEVEMRFSAREPATG